MRTDVGALWENFVFMELYKKSRATGGREEFYFWRTHQGAEVDIITEKDAKIVAYECKWSGLRSAQFTKFLAVYPQAETVLIHRENYLDFM